MEKQTTPPDRRPRRADAPHANAPVDPAKGAEQIETDFRVSQDRPEHAIDLNPMDFPAEGSHEEIERSARPGGASTGPDASNARVPRRDPRAPTPPLLESDDRIEHARRPGGAGRNPPKH